VKKFVCTVCGYVHEGDAPPAACPQCKAPASKFVEQKAGAALTWADEHRIGVAAGVDPEVVEGLRANFTGECTEVGMYLAMSRQADREGYPEVAEAYKRIAFEEAEHAAKFAELLGECVCADTKKNSPCGSRPSTAPPPARRPWPRRPRNWGTMPSTTRCMRCARTRPAMVVHFRVC
jgi:hypothetical protein